MLVKEKMRKADVFSGMAFIAFGLWVIGQAFKMPMKDSWGGVMNVWYVSPALMPLLVGSMITLLGAMLCRTALKAIGFQAFKDTLRWLASPDLVRLLRSDVTARFYAIAFLFLTLVFVNLPRIDFFLCAVLFLVAFITMFHFYDDDLMRRCLFLYGAGEVGFIIYFALGLHAALNKALPFGTDLIAIGFIVAYALFVWVQIRREPGLRRKYRTGLIVALVTPFVIGFIFKYFLMVPLPKEGLIVAGLDHLYYFDF